MAFCDELKAVSEGIWRRELEHPFVRGIGDGTLPPERFRFYLEQDYVFLIDYARVFALAVSKAPDLAAMSEFAKLCADTLGVEMELHRSACAEFGVTPGRLPLGHLFPRGAQRVVADHGLGIGRQLAPIRGMEIDDPVDVFFLEFRRPLPLQRHDGGRFQPGVDGGLGNRALLRTTLANHQGQRRRNHDPGAS